MLEALVLATCLSTEPACSPAARAYYGYRPFIRQYIKKERRKIVKYAGEWVLFAVPAVAIAQGRTSAQIRISRNLSLRVSENQTIVNLSAEF